jgi:hypothetical protein
VRTSLSVVMIGSGTKDEFVFVGGGGGKLQRHIIAVITPEARHEVGVSNTYGRKRTDISY